VNLPILPGNNIAEWQKMVAANPGLAHLLGSPLLPPPNLPVQPMAIAPPLAYQPNVSEEKIRAIMAEELNRHMPRFQTFNDQFETIFKSALSEEEYKAFHEYVAAGSPKFDEILKSDALHPIAQLLWEAIKEFPK
jgi:hypothetical protein